MYRDFDSKKKKMSHFKACADEFNDHKRRTDEDK